ncbi:MAG: hypothetical protein A2Z20_09935 [Bdellovibrionales bacterium RBG_16_40_8]|nr:MAG: hypothetical protein A2Z20_09935 [Bdellovibrionales bacterium RBG_16_40_8]
MVNPNQAKYHEKLEEIKVSIDNSLAEKAAPIAAFDADGTLWNMDLGEHFFEYQIRNKLLPNLPKNPWNTYWEMQKESPPKAYLWLAQINSGQTESNVRKWAQMAFAEINPVPVFSLIHEIIKHLQKRSVKIYVITASIKWAVEPGAKFLGIEQDNVIGIKTQVQKGIITDQLDGSITWRDGKVAGLLNATSGKHPFFAAGNTMGDFALLESATHLQFVNCAATKDHHNYETEQKLLSQAKERGWFYDVSAYSL